MGQTVNWSVATSNVHSGHRSMKYTFSISSVINLKLCQSSSRTHRPHPVLQQRQDLQPGHGAVQRERLRRLHGRPDVRGDCKRLQSIYQFSAEPEMVQLCSW